MPVPTTVPVAVCDLDYLALDSLLLFLPLLDSSDCTKQFQDSHANQTSRRRGIGLGFQPTRVVPFHCNGAMPFSISPAAVRRLALDPCNPRQGGARHHTQLAS